MVFINSHSLNRISVEPLLKRYGIGKRREKMEPIYQEMLNEVEHLAAPEAIHLEFQPTDLAELSPWLQRNTTEIVLALCTLGPHLQSRLHELVQTDLVEAVVFDEITLAWVTAITRQIHGSIRTKVKGRGLKAGPAYRPGLGRWPLETQRIVFARLPADSIGVTLDEFLVMTPKQSTSLIIPILDKEHVARIQIVE